MTDEILRLNCANSYFPSQQKGLFDPRSLKFGPCLKTMGLLIDFSFTVKAATLIFIPGRGSAISSVKQGKAGTIYNLVKN